MGVTGKFVAVGGLRVLLSCSTWPGRQLLFAVVGPPADERVLVVVLLAVPPLLVVPRRCATNADMDLRSAADKARCVDAR